MGKAQHIYMIDWKMNGPERRLDKNVSLVLLTIPPCYTAVINKQTLACQAG